MGRRRDIIRNLQTFQNGVMKVQHYTNLILIIDVDCLGRIWRFFMRVWSLARQY